MKITVCVPTLNAEKIWAVFSPSVFSQRPAVANVFVLDSSSTDDTADLARRDGCRVVTVPREEFRHGGTRQRAAELAADADILVYLTQDSILADPNALANLIAAFDDPSVGAAYGRQLPRPGSRPIEAHARLFNYPPVSSVRSVESVAKLGFKTIFFSNSFGAYRRNALLEVGGFPTPLNFGEDTVVAARLLQTGWKVAYCADAQAYHSHNYSLREEFWRYREIGRLHASEPELLRDFGAATGEGRKFVFSEMRYLLQKAPWLIPEAGLRTLLKYAGYRGGRRVPQR